MLACAIAAASCTPADKPAPVVTPSGGDRFLIDPRVGYDVPISPLVAPKFETAWRWTLAGDELEAQRRLAEILTRNPDFVPATLAGAALDIRAGRLAQAGATVAEMVRLYPNWTAARVYQAELAYRDKQTRVAYDLYRALADDPNAPGFVDERVDELRGAVFNDLYAAAQSAPDTEAVRLLREALALNAGAIEPRILLAQKLVAQKQYDTARTELEPLLNTAPDRSEVQEMLAEIDAGRGRYQEAIVRYERLARRTNEERYARRLEEIKVEWSAANMPAHYRTALNSDSITRAELATLLYWTVPSVRFAQNLGTPPIATDIENVPGREEIIRAIALGLFDVDPVTRRVSAYRQVGASRLASHLARVLQLRGAPCARGLTQDRVLPACAVTLPAHAPEDPISGREAVAALQQVAKALQ
ncbi:MAG TPA: tetratricopeptide repeat protein [Thermoanaerobaculia bacterium]|nr:tetratricopeptide repeat protein [Thermoanaerobaculia bacterium]